MADIVYFALVDELESGRVVFEDLNVWEEIGFWEGVKEHAFLTLETCVKDVRLSQH